MKQKNVAANALQRELETKLTDTHADKKTLWCGVKNKYRIETHIYKYNGYLIAGY